MEEKVGLESNTQVNTMDLLSYLIKSYLGLFL